MVLTFSLNDYLFDLHAPLKYLKKQHNKIWITNGIANLYDSLYYKFCHAKDNDRKEEIQKICKTYQNHVANFTAQKMKFSIKDLFSKFEQIMWQTSLHKK